MNLVLRIITLLFLISPIFSVGLVNDIEVELTFMVLSIISSYLLFYNASYSISLMRMFSFFLFIFLCYAPIVQFKNKILLYGVNEFSFKIYKDVNLLLIVCVLALFLSYLAMKNILKKTLLLRKNVSEELIINPNKKLLILLLISFLCFAIVFSSKGFSVNNMFFRGIVDENLNVLEIGTLWLITTYFVRPLPLIILLFVLVYFKKKKIALFFFSVIALITVFPTSMARFSIAALYLPILLITFKFLHKKYLFQFLLISSLFIVFPFLDLFRRYEPGKELSFTPSLDMFKEGHFDTYQSLLSVYKWDLITNGNQILGSVFFWVPRIIWPNKPLGSGSFLATTTDYRFNNVSCNFFAEGYINFGVFGAIFFACILGIIIGKLDFSYEHKTYKTKSFIIVYYILLGFIVFILRGDLLSSFAYLCGFLFGISLINKILKF